MEPGTWNPSAPRFVILRHDCPPDYERGLHWDFMLESGAVLKTWALSQEPAEGVEIAAAALADHRLAYLEYDGPVSGGRGTVTRWDQGDYRVVSQMENEWIVDLSGERLNGRATIRRSPGAINHWSWRLTATPES